MLALSLIKARGAGLFLVTLKVFFYGASRVLPNDELLNVFFDW